MASIIEDKRTSEVKKMSTSNRFERLNEVLSFLERNGGHAKFQNVYNHMFREFQITRNTVWNYLEDLKMAGKIDYKPPTTQSLGLAR